MRFSLLTLCAASALAAPAVVEERAAGPSVTVQHGTVVGSSSGGVDSFKGIPFAQPPVGQLRLKPPQPLTSSFGTFDATKTPANCPQFIASTNTSLLPANALGILLDLPFFQPVLNTKEDCLTINVQRPSNPTAKGPLPVIFWIFGGGFELGGTELPPYDGTDLIKRSSQLGSDVIYVAVNYRVAGLGFLAGKELQKEGSTNLGLRDQRLGLQWVADNIAAFGGDPSRVTIWGESAGAISVFDHLLINNGDNTYNGKALFHGAIMNSGSAIPALDVASDKAQAIFDQVASAGGCGSASDKLACLRALSLEKFQDASHSVAALFSYRSLDLSYLPRPDPHDSFLSAAPSTDRAAGSIADVPLIIGDQEDEGTLFSLTLFNLTTTDDVVTYLKSYFPLASRADIQGLVDAYPQDPAQGSPFNTGPLYAITPENKRLSAILGDITFTLTRRATLAAFKKGHPNTPVYTYLSTWLRGLPLLGTLHGSDLLEIYAGGTPYPSPRDTFFNRYIAFANKLDPNALPGQPGASPSWPQWTDSDRGMLQLDAFNNEVIKDNFREAAYQYLAQKEAVLYI